MTDTLALFGGKPIVSNHAKLRIDWPIVTARDIDAIKKTLERHDFSGRGSQEISKLEKEFSSQFGGLHATALNSGTAALHAALASVNVQPGDEVIVPSLTFIATALAVVQNHSIPVFADINPQTYNISPESIASKLTKRTKAIIVVHLHGFPAQIEDIQKLCRTHHLKLIEDVAQAPGAKVNGKLLGTFGDAAIFSLMSQKNLATCGECGILLNKTLHEKNRAEMLRIYGEIIRPHKERLYNSFTLGWNYTLNPMQAAMARSQLKRFRALTKRIQAAGRRFTTALKNFDWIYPPREEIDTEAVFHFYRIRLDGKKFSFPDPGKFRKAVQDALNAEGLNVRHYQNTPLPGQPIFRHKNRFNGGVPWSCYKHKIKYSIDDYPNTLDVLRNTLILGAIGSAPAYLLCPKTIEKYIAGFQKIERNMDQLLAYANHLQYKEPWEELAVTSDSFHARYGIRMR
jgi:dTDP-4-amino-4,6-dideoxygalactose transaminase